MLKLFKEKKGGGYCFGSNKFKKKGTKKKKKRGQTTFRSHLTLFVVFSHVKVVTFQSLKLYNPSKVPEIASKSKTTSDVNETGKAERITFSSEE